MVRLRGGQAPEEFFIQVRNFDDTVIAEFDPRNRDGNTAWTAGFSTDLNLDDYDWQPEKGRPDVFKFSLSDPAQVFQNEVQEGYKVRAAFGNIMKDCVLALDMETLNAAGEMLDLSLKGNNGVITGTTDLVGYWGRARDFNGTSDKIEVADDPTLIFPSGFTFCIVTTPDIDTATGSRTFVNEDNSFIIRQVDDVLHFFVYDGVDFEPHAEASNVFTAGETARIIVTADGTDHKIYVDGKEVATLARTFLPPATGNPIQIGVRSTEWFDGKLDKVAALTRAFSAVEVREHDDRRAAVPRYYFDGRIDNRKHDEGETQVVVSSKLKELTDIEVYDFIYEGMRLADTVVPAHVHEKFLALKPPDANHDTTYVQFVDADGNNLLDSTGEVYGPVLQYPDQSETKQLGEVSMWWDTGSSPTSRTWYAKFTARSTKIKSIGVNINPKSVALSTIQVRITRLDKDVNGDLTVRTVIASKSFTTIAEDAYRWYFVSGFTPTTYELEPDAVYYISVEDPGNANWTLAAPAFWGGGDGSREVFMESPASTFAKKNFGLNVVIQQTNNYIALNTEEFQVKKADNADLLVADFESETVLSAPTQVVDEFIQATYFYSEDIMNVSDVLDRILEKTELVGQYNGSGGVGSSAPTTPLGLYIPQGGTAWEHLSQVSALVGDRPRFIAPKTISFQRWPEPIHIRNSSFELPGNGSDPLLGWGVEATGPSAWTLDTTEQYSGDSSAKLNYLATSDLPRLFHDVESFDPVVSGVDGKNFEIALRINSTIIPVNIRVYDYGSFDNDNIVLLIPAATMTINTWTIFRFKVDRPSFRLAITPAGSGTISYQFWVDDVFPHYENQRSFFLADAGAKDADYTSGFMPGMRVGESQIGVHIYDDVEGPPNIQRETDKRSINYAVQFGRQASSDSGPPVLAIARNKARATQIGTRLKVARQESLRSTEMAYLRAKQRLRFESRFRSTVTLVGQYPHLFGKIIRLFFPNHGLYEATPMEVTSIILGPSTTEVRFTRSFVEEFQDVEKLKEREDMLSGAFNAPDFDTLMYFTTADLPTTVDPTAVVQARLKDDLGGTSDYAPLKVQDTRDGSDASVWVWMVGQKDGPTFNTTTTAVWNRIDIANATPTVLATITLPQEFAKLPNQWIVIWLFAGVA